MNLQPRKHWVFIIAVAIVCIFTLAYVARFFHSAAVGSPQAPLKTVTVTMNGHHIIAERADTFEEQSKGLSFRPSLASDHGMLFVYPFAAPQSLGMIGMQFPLDFIFLDQGVVVDYEEKVPPPSQTHNDPAIVTSLKDARSVLAIGSGLAEAWDIRIGTKVTIEP